MGTLGLGLYPMGRGMLVSMKKDNMSKILLFSFVWSFFAYSMLGHKEHRFLMPLFPLVIAYMALGLSNANSTFVKIYSMCNVALAMYLSLVHQTGPNAVVHHLSSKPDSKGILFLTP